MASTLRHNGGVNGPPRVPDHRTACVPSPHWQLGQSWFREKLSPVKGTKARDEQISRKNVSGELGSRSWCNFAKNIALLGAKNGVQHATAIYPPWYIRVHCTLWPLICPSIHLSVRSFTTFSGFCTFADKSLGGNGIKFGMLMYPDDLSSTDIDADGYCFHFVPSSICPTVRELGFWYCWQISGKKKSAFWHADVSRWLALSLFMLVVIFVRLSVCLFTTISSFFAFADKSLGTDGIKFGKLISVFSELPHTASMPMGIVVISCVRPSVKLSMNLGFGTADKSLGRKVYLLACQCIQITNSQFVYAYGYPCPSVRPFTTFSGFCAFADKSLRRNDIKIGMLIYPDDLPLADIDADGCCHLVHLSIRLTMHGVWVLRTNRLEEMVYILACWYMQITCPQFIDAYGYYCPSVHSSGHLGWGLGWARGWLLPSLGDTGDNCCHYWQHILVVLVACGACKLTSSFCAWTSGHIHAQLNCFQ